MYLVIDMCIWLDICRFVCPYLYRYVYIYNLLIFLWGTQTNIYTVQNTVDISDCYVFIASSWSFLDPISWTSLFMGRVHSSGGWYTLSPAEVPMKYTGPEDQWPTNQWPVGCGCSCDASHWLQMFPWPWSEIAMLRCKVPLVSLILLRDWELLGFAFPNICQLTLTTGNSQIRGGNSWASQG